MTDKFSLVPRTMGEALDYSKVIADSNFCPKEYRGRPGDVLVAVQYGLELGIMPLQALQGIATINGKPTIYGDLALAVVRGSGLMEDFEETDPAVAAQHGKASCKSKRKGQATPLERSFSVDDAKKARLWGKPGPWQDYPGRMLVMRARSWLLRDLYADVLKGLQMREEVLDYQDVTATVVPVRTTAPIQIQGRGLETGSQPVRVAQPRAAETGPRPVITVDMEREAQEMDPGEQHVVTYREAGDEPIPPDDDGMPSDLKAVMDRIAAAKDLPALVAVATDAALLEDSLKALAKKAYLARQAELRKAAQ